MNIESVDDITNLKLKTANKPKGWYPGMKIKCFACDSYKQIHSMYSQDWCKACYKYWLKCKFQKKPFVPWKDRTDKDKYESWR